MARNRTPEYINRLRSAKAPNGFRFDIANYLYNPSYDHDYPHFIKVVAEDGDTEKVKAVFYEKYYDGSGAYKVQTYHRKKNENGWQVVTSVHTETLEEARRFSLPRLLEYCTD